MRRIVLALALLFGITALLVGCSSSTTSSITDVNAQEFLERSAEPGTVVVDVRTEVEYTAGHVAGSVNIDVESDAFDSEIAALPTDTTYAVYCRSGRRSAVASQRMADAGFTSLVNLQDGGLAELEAAGAPIAAG